MKKAYIKPEIEILNLDNTADILTTSPYSPGTYSAAKAALEAEGVSAENILALNLDE